MRTQAVEPTIEVTGIGAQLRLYPGGSPPSAAAEGAAAPLPRLAAIEGLRAYLALWVLVCHVMWTTGYEVDELSMLPQILATGRYAVHVFMIISGFVIFYLLDKQRESAAAFLVRRFFRIFPAFFLLFLLAIPVSLLVAWNTAHTPYLSSDHAHHFLGLIDSWWANIQWHMPLHALMLHGAVPWTLLEDSGMAFLAPAWSLSTEWQFYLIAPAAFAIALSPKPLHRVALCAACLCFFVLARCADHIFPDANMYAALPSVLEYFFIGAASYFLYKRNAPRPFFDAVFPVFASIGIFLFVLGGESRTQLVPLVLWIIFLGLILEHPACLCSRFISPLFTHRWSQYLGRISYSLYLSHMLVMAVAQFSILKFAQDLSQPVHFALLLAATASISILVSDILYRCVEAPAMEFGKRLAKRVATQTGRAPLRPLTPATQTLFGPTTSG